MSQVRCPTCDAEPGEKCYDPNGDFAFKDMHAARMEAEIAQRLEDKDYARHQSEITRINREIGRLIAERSEHEKAISGDG